MTTVTVLLALLLACGDKDGGDGDGGVDDTGNPTEGTDADADGWSTPEDCDDNNAAVNPDATEICNDRDDDCDGLIDDDDDSLDTSTLDTFYTDADADGYGADGAEVKACAQPSGTAAVDGDCDDANAAANPGATEICDDLDNDCDGLVDDDDDSLDLSTASTVYTDLDGDGFGTDESKLTACGTGPGTAEVGGDCDDGNDAVYPGAEEVCDEADNDCDDETSEDGIITVAGVNQPNLSVALETASESDQILVCAGEYVGPFATTKKAAIVGVKGASATTLTAARGNAILTAGADLSVEGLTFSGGSGTYTGGIDAFSAGTALNVDIEGCVFTGNSGAFGGAILAYNDSVLTVANTQFTDNSSTSSGGAVYMQSGSFENVSFSGNSSGNAGALWIEDGTVTMDRDCLVSGNTATTGSDGTGGLAGGALLYGADLTLATGAEFTANSAAYGGGVMVYAFTDETGAFFPASLSGGDYSLNDVTASGGGVLLSGTGASATDIVVNSNTANWGGGVSMESDDNMLDSAEIYDNAAAAYGGGILFPVAGSNGILVSDTLLDSNSASYGGAVANEGAEITFEECEITSNGADEFGGGFYIYSASVTLSGGQVTGNSAVSENGGGVWMYLSELFSFDVDWGTDTTDNAPDDIYIEQGDTGDTGDVGTSYGDYGTGETFACDSDGCDD